MVPGQYFRKYLLGPTQVHKTIYVADVFDQDDVVLIQEAAQEWERETHGLAKIDIRYGFDMSLFESLNHQDDSIVMVRADVDDEIVHILDERINTTILGYFLTEFGTQIILVVPDRMLGREYYRGVIMHEMGHSLGLSHLNVDDTIMVDTMDRSSYHLSKRDIEWFCRAYYCDAAKLGGI